MQYLGLLLTTYVAAVLDTALAPTWAIGRVVPDCLALTAAAWCLSNVRVRPTVVAIVVGLVADLLSPGRVGLVLACYLLAAHGAVAVRRRIPLKSPLVNAALAGLLTAFVTLVPDMAQSIGSAGSPPVTALVASSLATGAYTAAVVLPCFMVTHWLPQGRDRRATRGALA